MKEVLQLAVSLLLLFSANLPVIAGRNPIVLRDDEPVSATMVGGENDTVETTESGTKIYRLPGPARALEERDSQRRNLVTGKVVAVDAKRKTLTIKGREATVSLSVTERTSIIIDGRKRNLADIGAGDNVTANYRTTGNRNTAQSILVRAAPPKQPEKEN